MLGKFRRLLPHLDSVELRTNARPLLLGFDAKDPLELTARQYFLRRFDLPFTRHPGQPLWVHPIESKEQPTFKILSEKALPVQPESLRPAVYLATVDERLCFVLTPTNEPLPFPLLAHVGTLQNPSQLVGPASWFDGDFQVLSANTGRVMYLYYFLLGVLLANFVTFVSRMWSGGERAGVVTTPALRQEFEDFRATKKH